MNLTLISSLTNVPTQIDALEDTLPHLKTDGLGLTLWLRDKTLQTQDLPLDRLGHLARKTGLRLSWSWCHRQAASTGERLHIPDDAAIRSASADCDHTRVLSCHDLRLAEQLLSRSKQDHVLLSPWRPAISKITPMACLDQAAALALAHRYPARVHLVSGLTPNDRQALKHTPFASLCFKGAFMADPIGFLPRLVLT